FTAKEDPEHTRGGAPDVTAEGADLTNNGNGTYTLTPTGAVTITVTFDPITVGPSDKDFTDLAAAVAEAQDGDTINVDPGTYGAIDVKGKAIKIVATSSYATNTIIDAQGLTRAVNLADGAEIIGFTIQGGVASEGAGVNGGTVRRCIIKDNKLTYNGTGAGICNVDLAESCLIYNNGSADVARSNGGGAANSFLLNCTVAQNTASSGAGLYDCTAKNCVVALNTDLSGAAADWYGESLDVDPSDCCTPIEGSHEVIDATAIFVSPETNDWRLRAGVPCIDAGEADDRLSDKDIAGVNRVYNNTVDMGALEWNSPDYEITIDFQGRGQVTAKYGSTTKTITAKETIKVPRTTKTMTFTWTSAGEVTREFKGVYIDGESVSTTTTTEWTITAANTVHATLLFTANDLEATTDDATDVLADAIAGEVINLAAGTYEDQLEIGANVTVVGAATDTVILAGGATLADGAALTKVSATAPIVGPEEGSAELSYAKVYDVTTDTAVRNLVVKTVLIRDSLNGVANSTVYLSTIVNNTGTGVAESTVHGSVLWNNGSNTDLNSTLTDCYEGDTPAFTLPYPDGDDYTLTGRSPLIDLAGTPAWEGFDATDFATDLAGNARPNLAAYDVGAYEYQAPENTNVDTYWTWYGNNYDVDGNIGDAAWTRMKYGAPQKFADGDEIYFVDRTGFQTATIGIDVSSYVSKTYLNISRVLNLVDAGGLLMTEAIENRSSGTLNLAGPMMIGGQFASSTGKINVVDGASVIVGGLWQNTGSMPVTISGGTISTEQAYFGNTTTLNQTGGTFNFGTLLSLRDTAEATFAGGTVTGGRISV
ncbi:MAG: choice-of-anchor Q domain-containing protein, partial [bacterium]|nr:choice-of-anchor Q domain-containing protein [bacterium]